MDLSPVTVTIAVAVGAVVATFAALHSLPTVQFGIRHIFTPVVTLCVRKRTVARALLLLSVPALMFFAIHSDYGAMLVAIGVALGCAVALEDDERVATVRLTRAENTLADLVAADGRVGQRLTAMAENIVAVGNRLADLSDVQDQLRSAQERLRTIETIVRRATAVTNPAEMRDPVERLRSDLERDRAEALALERARTLMTRPPAGTPAGLCNMYGLRHRWTRSSVASDVYTCACGITLNAAGYLALLRFNVTAGPCISPSGSHEWTSTDRGLMTATCAWCGGTATDELRSQLEPLVKAEASVEPEAEPDLHALVSRRRARSVRRPSATVAPPLPDERAPEQVDPDVAADIVDESDFRGWMSVTSRDRPLSPEPQIREIPNDARPF